MARAAKVPLSYHFYIAALQRLIPLTAGDSRIDVKGHITVAEAVNEITKVLADASMKGEPVADA